MNDYIYNKSKETFMPVGTNLDVFAKQYDMTGINHKQLKILMALDDWPTIATWAMPLIKTAGQKAI